MISSKHKQIDAGINYLKIINNASVRGEVLTAKDLAEQFDVTEQEVKDAIHAAKENKDASRKIPEAKLKQPFIKIYRDLLTGHRQSLRSIEVELLKEIMVKFDESEVTEFTTMMPIKITVRRNV